MKISKRCCFLVFIAEVAVDWSPSLSTVAPSWKLIYAEPSTQMK